MDLNITAPEPAALDEEVGSDADEDAVGDEGGLPSGLRNAIHLCFLEAVGNPAVVVQRKTIWSVSSRSWRSSCRQRLQNCRGVPSARNWWRSGCCGSASRSGASGSRSGP